MQKLCFTLIFIGFTYLLCELVLRIGLTFLNFPFLKPYSILENKFYPEVSGVIESTSVKDPEIKKVLLLGGSVISSGWSRMESRLDTLLPVKYGQDYTYAIYNIAEPGHSSLDNLIKYELLKSIKFDLVLFYEAINENRANNVPYDWFENDYTHIKWYDDVEMIRKHKELNFTVIPYVFHKLYNVINKKLRHRPYQEFHEVNPEFVMYGDSIQTARTYERNLTKIIEMAKEKNETLVLIRYSTYFPENVDLTGDEKDHEYYSPCQFATPVNVWGSANNVKKGVNIHNKILEKLAGQYKVNYLNFELPQSAEYFCDVCHVSEKGAVLFAQQLTDYISREKLLDH